MVLLLTSRHLPAQNEQYFQHILHLVLVFLLLTFNAYLPARYVCREENLLVDFLLENDTLLAKNIYSICVLAKLLSCVVSTYVMYEIHSEIPSEIYKIRSADSLKLVHDMITTYSETHHKDKYLQHSSIIWPVWLNCWVLLYELSGCGFKSHCCHKHLFLSILNINKLYTQNENEMYSISWPQLHKGLIKC